LLARACCCSAPGFGACSLLLRLRETPPLGSAHARRRHLWQHGMGLAVNGYDAPPTNAVTAAGRQIDTAASRRATEGNELCTGADGQQHWVQPPRAELGDRMVLTTEQKLQLYRDGKQCNAPATPIYGDDRP
jgi:hypothetical protein